MFMSYTRNMTLFKYFCHQMYEVDIVIYAFILKNLKEEEGLKSEAPASLQGEVLNEHQLQSDLSRNSGDFILHASSSYEATSRHSLATRPSFFEYIESSLGPTALSILEASLVGKADGGESLASSLGNVQMLCEKYMTTSLTFVHRAYPDHLVLMNRASKISSMANCTRTHCGWLPGAQSKVSFDIRWFSCRKSVGCALNYTPVQWFYWRDRVSLCRGECQTEEDIVTLWCSIGNYGAPGGLKVCEVWSEWSGTHVWNGFLSFVYCSCHIQEAKIKVICEAWFGCAETFGNISGDSEGCLCSKREW